MSTELALVWFAIAASGIANLVFMWGTMGRQDAADRCMDAQRGILDAHLGQMNAQHDWLVTLNNELHAQNDRLKKLEGITTEGP